MTKAEQQAVAACSAILHIRKGLLEKLGSLMRLEPVEQDEEEETGVYWLGARVSVKTAGRIDAPPRGETVKPRGSLLRYPPEKTPLHTGLGGIR
jgi:hypothetical protein